MAAVRRQRVGNSAVAAGSMAAVLAARRWWRQSSDSAAAAALQQQHGSGGRAAAARWRAAWWQCWPVRQQRGGKQHGSGVGTATAPATGSTPAAASLAAAAEVWRRCSVSSGSRAGGAALPPHAATVATKTPAATVMAGSLPTINNQLKAAAAMAMETMTAMTHKT